MTALLNHPVHAYFAKGRLIDIANLSPHDIHWSEIANGLSKLARFNGAYTCTAYSVAQHCVMGADALYNEKQDTTLAAYFLLHDAHEAFMGDITLPTVNLIADKLAAYGKGASEAFLRALEESKHDLDKAIFQQAKMLNLSNFADRHLVHDMDKRMLRAEITALFGASAAKSMPYPNLSMPRTTGAIKPWGAMKAEEAWLDRLSRYLGITARTC